MQHQCSIQISPRNNVLNLNQSKKSHEDNLRGYQVNRSSPEKLHTISRRNERNTHNDFCYILTPKGRQIKLKQLSPETGADQENIEPGGANSINY